MKPISRSLTPLLTTLIGAGALLFTTANAETNYKQIPRLPDGPHLGYIEGFDDLRPQKGEPDREVLADEIRAQSIAAGMSIGRAQIDWADLEFAPGKYDAGELANAIDHARSGGLAVYVTFSTIDTFELTLPDYLMGSDGRVKGGKRLDSPYVADRFDAFLNWFIPELKKHNVWGISIGNEVDAMISNDNLSQKETLNHLLQGVRKVKALDPDLSVSVTLTGMANKTAASFTRDLVKELDLVTYNHYCLNDYLQVNGQNEWRATLNSWKKTAKGKQLFIQELGCPVGYGDEGAGAKYTKVNGLNGTPEIQRQFFEFYFNEILNDEQLRAATIFQLFDWSPDLSKVLGDYMRAAGEPVAGSRLEEWLATTGICRWADASCRPAYDSFLQAQRKLKAKRGQ